MTPFSILILVCSMALDRAACQPETALDKIQVPVANELQCGLKVQAVWAANGAALAPRPGLEYVKIMCRRSASLDTRKTVDFN